MKKITTALQFEDISTHSLRHTFATLHLTAGANMLWVSRQLGHASIQTTVDTYGRGSNPEHPEYQEAMTDTLNVAVSQAKFAVRRAEPQPVWAQF
jgi:integrase